MSVLSYQMFSCRNIKFSIYTYMNQGKILTLEMKLISIHTSDIFLDYLMINDLDYVKKFFTKFILTNVQNMFMLK